MKETETARHERLAHADAPHATEDEENWGPVAKVFAAFGGAEDMVLNSAPI